jgi:anti-anti-sigma factor
MRDGMLTLRIEGEGVEPTIALSGELDISNAATLASALERVEAEEPATITIDMSELEFIDSTGIALLVSAHRRLDADDDLERLRLVPSRATAVRRVMQVTGLDRGLPFRDPLRQ